MTEKTAFLEMFPCCGSLQELCGGLENAQVETVTISREQRTMEIVAKFGRTPSPAELSALEGRIAGFFGLQGASIHTETPTPEVRKTEQKKKTGKVLYGRAIKGKPIPMSAIRQDSGRVAVKGKVFEVENREIEKRNAVVLSFSMTDYTGSIHVSKFLANPEEKKLADQIKKGMVLSVQGNVSFNRYDEDIAIDPASIVRETEEIRQDLAEGEKRVELHLHTRYSSMDALTDPEAAIKRAESWGHRAIAITDHGVAQAFPDAWVLSKKVNIKIIYGLEGYLVNDVDDRLAVHGQSSCSLHGEFVAFDLETTGLSAYSDRITEIGGVIYRDGKPGERFQSFVNPGMPIPAEVQRLTGITDRDVFDAPAEAEAVRAFLDFCGDRPLVAHNADFDVSFISAACERAGYRFDPVYIDTVALGLADAAAD